MKNISINITFLILVAGIIITNFYFINYNNPIMLFISESLLLLVITILFIFNRNNENSENKDISYITESSANLFRNLPETICILDNEFNVKFITSEFCRIFNIVELSIIHNSLLNYIEDDFRSDFISKSKSVLKGHSKKSIVLNFKNNNGNSFNVDITLYYLWAPLKTIFYNINFLIF